MTSENINDDRLQPGDELLGYHVLEFVKEGGWAYIYKAQHPKLPKVVALKQLKPELVKDEKKLQRFLDEANIVAQLNHPNVVMIHDVEQDPETELYFISTEFAEKGDLADRLDESPESRLPIDEVLHLALGICSGLAAAHRKGVVHQDIKPSNVLLFDVGEERGMPKVIDFGIAQASAIESSDTTERIDIPKGSSMHGSLPYMSPEQLDKDIDVDNRSDLYSLGITLYELLTGHLPFTGDTQAIFWAHQFQLPTPLRELRSDIPDSLEQIVLQALQKDPQERYQSAADMHEALENILDISARKERQHRFSALRERGLAHLEAGEQELAAEVLGQASALEPEDEQVQEGLEKIHEQSETWRLYELGSQCLEKETWEEAQKHLTQVMAYDPDYADGQAREKLEQATLEVEREHKERESKHKRRGLMIHYRTGVGHFRKWEWEQAIGKLEQVVAQDPEFEEATDKLAEARRYARSDSLLEQAQHHMEGEEWKEAVDTLEEVKLLRPPHIDVTEKLEYAREKWIEARKKQELDDWYDEGIAQLKTEDLEQAKITFSKIYALRPDYRDVEDLLGEIDEKMKKERHLNQLLEQAREYETNGRWEQVISVCGKVLAIRPRHQEASRCLRRAQKHIARREFNWLRCLVIATATVVPCTLLIAQVVKDFTPLIFSMGFFLLLAVVPLSISIEKFIAQRVKARSESQTNQ